MRVQSFVKVPSYLGWWMQPRFGLKISELDFYRLAGGSDFMWFCVIPCEIVTVFSLDCGLEIVGGWVDDTLMLNRSSTSISHKPSFHISACPIGPPAPSMFQLQVCHCLTWPGATGIWHELPVEGISSPSKGGSMLPRHAPSMLPRNLPNKKKPSRTTEGRRFLISW